MTATLPRARALVRRANADGLAADRAVATVWSQILAVLDSPRGYADDYHRTVAALRGLPLAVANVLRERLLGSYHAGRQAAVQSVTPALRRRLREDDLADLAAQLMPAPAAQQVLAWLDRFIRPQDFALIGNPGSRRLPEDLARQLASGISQGKTSREVAKEIRPYLDGSRVRARRAARTFGLHAAHQGQWDAWQQAGELIAGWTIHATLDAVTRPEHRARDGTQYFKDPAPGQKSVAEMPRPPLEADGTIAWNCLLPGTVVQGTIEAGVEVRYAGKAFEIVAASGAAVRVTANHPVFTPEGLVPAYRLRKGQYVLRHIGSVERFTDDEHHAPARVEDVLGALMKLPRKVSFRPGVFDLHGDEEFIEGDINVVLAQWELLPGRQTQGSEGRGEGMFIGGGCHASDMTGNGPLDFPLFRVTPTLSSTVGSGSLSSARLGIGDLRPFHALRFGAAAQLDASRYHSSHQTSRGPAAEFSEIPPRDTNFVREFLERFPGQVALDKIVKVRHFEFSGHVYDLQGKGGWIVANAEDGNNGIFLSNCRCFLVPILSA